MKNKILALNLAVAAIMLCSCGKGEKSIVAFDELPQEAQTFVSTHFADKQVASVLRDNDLFDQDYEVLFSDGASVDFDKNGNWTDVEDRDADGVPSLIVPDAISTYCVSNFAGQLILQISKDKKGYEIELSNSLELDFDKDGNLVGADS